MSETRAREDSTADADVRSVRCADVLAGPSESFEVLTPASVLALQRGSGNQAVGRLLRARSQRPPERRRLARHPVGTAGKAILKKGMKWIAKRHKTISKHVAEHFLPAATRKLVHGVFAVPNIKRLAMEALSKPDRVVQEASRGGQWVVEKAFGREIGKSGERILRVVLTTGGKVVTAYPIKEFAAAGTAAAVMYISIDDACAAARPKLETVEEDAQRKIEAAQPGFWEEMLSDIVTFGLYGGEAGAFEDIYLWAARQQEKIVNEAGEKAVQDVMQAQQRSIDQAETDRIKALVAAGLMGVEYGEAEEPAEEDGG